MAKIRINGRKTKFGGIYSFLSHSGFKYFKYKLSNFFDYRKILLRKFRMGNGMHLQDNEGNLLLCHYKMSK